MPQPATADYNLAASLWRAAAVRPDHPAIVERGTPHSYASLRDRAAALGAELRATGVMAGDRVVILLEPGFDSAAAIFGAYAIGAAAVVVNDRLRPRQVEYAVNRVGARALVTRADVLTQQPRPIGLETPVIDVSAIGPANVAITGVMPRGPGDIAQLIYTSGSTGLPRAAVFTHGAIGTGVTNVLSYLALDESDRVAGLLAFSAVYGLNQLLCTIRVGATLVIEQSPVPSRLIQGVNDHGITVLAAVPPLWLQLLSVPSFTRDTIRSLRQLQNAGGHLPTHAVRALRSAQPQAELFLQYGQTETFRGTYLPPSEVDRRPDSMGRAIPGAELLVIGEDQRLCGPGEVGELVHSGPTIAAGYWDDPEATSRVFRPHPLRAGAGLAVFSGDLARRDEDGFLYFVSRQDRLIKSLGFRVGPDEISDVVFASGEVKECVIDAEADAVRGERIVAYVALTEDGSRDRLARFCGTELPRHMQPARIVTLDNLPRLASGKYDLPAMRGAAANH